MKNLNLFQLEKQTGVSRKTWMRRKKVDIEKLKNNTIQIDFGGSGEKSYIIFEDVVKLIEKNWNNKSGMIRDFKIYQEVAMSLYDKAKESYEMKERVKKYKNEVVVLRDELKIAKKDIEYYRERYLSVTIQSASMADRKKEGLNDVMGVDSTSKSTLQKISSLNFKKDYSELFDKK